jgi:hypothetical protein
VSQVPEKLTRIDRDLSWGNLPTGTYEAARAAVVISVNQASAEAERMKRLVRGTQIRLG